jgi:hypothetical protein
MARVRRCSIYRLLCRSEDGLTLSFCRGSRTLLLRRGKQRCQSRTHSLLPRTSLLLPKTPLHSLLPRTSLLLSKTPLHSLLPNKSSSAEDTPTPALGIRLSEAVDQRLLQLSSSKTPEKEHSALEGDKDPGNESSSTLLSALHADGKARSSRTSLLGPWGDLDDEEDLPLPPKSIEKDSASSAIEGLDPNHFGLTPMSSDLFKQGHISELEQSSSTALKDGREWAFVSERHKFKSFSSPPKFDGETSGENNPGSGVTTDDEDDSSPPPPCVSSTEKVLNDIIEGTTAYREYIRSGGVPENAQWTSHLAKNLDEETRRTKSPPGTPLFQELDDERTLLRATQAKVPPLRVPLDQRLTEKELSQRN